MEILKVILTSLLSAVTLFVIAKLIGHKQLDFFDYITGITIGSVGAELEKSMKAFIAMIVYGVITVALSAITSRFSEMRKVINGAPTIIMDVRILSENLHRRGLDEKWLEKRIEEHGYKSAKEILLGVCDENNKVTLYENE